MRFFKRILTLGLLLSSLTATAAESMPDIEQSKVIVFISGKKYYIHTVQQGNTLYSIAKTYDISEAEIKEHNPNVTEGLKIGQTIKIPVSEKSMAQVEKRRKKEFIAHKIKAGQTLYSIARDYNISVATLREDNPSLNPQSLSIGETIWVRRTEVGTSSEQEAQSEINEYADNLNKAAEDGYEYVVVKPGETIYSLTRKYEITEEEFTSLNDVSAGLKAGAVVRIPNKTINSVDQMDKAADIAMQEEKNKTFTADENIMFQTVSSQDELNVSLMLPINVNSKPNASYVEFYQGFLLGLEKLKEQGKGKTNLAVYNTQHDTQAVQRIVNSPAFAKTNLIIGPVYEDELKPVINFAHTNAVPVVSPLANIVAVKSPALYQLSPDAECKYDKIADLIDGSRDIYLIYASAYDKEFEQEIKKQLEGKSYATYNYTFDQKSILTPTNALAQQIESVDELLKKEKPALFVVLANTETDVDRILGTLASSKVAITERSESCANYVVLGTSRWSRFNNIDQTSYFNNNVVMISTYHAKRDSALVREFDSRYIEAYKNS